MKANKGSMQSFHSSDKFKDLMEKLWQSEKIQNKYKNPSSKSEFIRNVVIHIALEEYPHVREHLYDCREFVEYNKKSLFDGNDEIILD